jgi:hypothetical protein
MSAGRSRGRWHEEQIAMEHDSGSGEPAGRAECEEVKATAEPPATAELEATAAAEPPATGERRVDAALSRLAELDELPVSEHPRVYERIHEQLVDVLGELHSAQAPAAGQGSADQGAG